MGIGGEVAIIGSGTIRFGENFDQSLPDMLAEAVTLAVQDAGLTLGDLQAAWLGTYLPMAWGYEGASGTAVAEPLHLYPIPVTRVSNLCCTGMEAVRNAAFAVASGAFDVALAVGVEKMRDVPSRGSLVAQHVERGHPLLCKGRTAPGMFALLATRYLEQNRLDEGTLDKVAVKNHEHGALNPRAHFRKAITAEAARKAPPVAEPLRLYDCCPTTDGAAAVILTRADRAREYVKDPVVIRGIGLAVANGYFGAQMKPDWDFLGFEATQRAAAAAYADAGVTDPARAFDVVECHDCFTITELINYEDLGLAPRGRGWELIHDNVTKLGGRLPVNTGGGLKSCGHPIGASGVRMINQIADQIRGRAGKMQVPKADLGLAHTLGGPGSVSTVFVLGPGA